MNTNFFNFSSQNPCLTAAVQNEAIYTFNQINLLTQSFLMSLEANNLSSIDKVILIFPASLQLLIISLALTKNEIPFILINPNLPKNTQEILARNFNASSVISHLPIDLSIEKKIVVDTIKANQALNVNFLEKFNFPSFFESNLSTSLIEKKSPTIFFGNYESDIAEAEASSRFLIGPINLHVSFKYQFLCLNYGKLIIYTVNSNKLEDVFFSLNKYGITHWIISGGDATVLASLPKTVPLPSLKKLIIVANNQFDENHLKKIEEIITQNIKLHKI